MSAGKLPLSLPYLGFIAKEHIVGPLPFLDGAWNFGLTQMRSWYETNGDRMNNTHKTNRTSPPAAILFGLFAIAIFTTTFYLVGCKGSVVNPNTPVYKQVTIVLVVPEKVITNNKGKVQQTWRRYTVVEDEEGIRYKHSGFSGSVGDEFKADVANMEEVKH